MLLIILSLAQPQIEQLQITLSALTSQAKEYENQLIQVSHVTLTDAQNLVTSLPERIENAKHDRQDRSVLFQTVIVAIATRICHFKL
jgi:flagellar biosynthesis chaperone FliJ